MKNFIFKALIVIGFAWTTISGLYLVVVPQEIKDMLPEFNWLTALISGGATGLFSSGAIYLKAIVGKNKIETSKDIEQFGGILTTIVNSFSEIKGLYNELDMKFNNILIEFNNKNVNDLSLLNELHSVKELLKTDLNAKLTNPLIDKDIAEEIRGVLNEKEDNL